MKPIKALANANDVVRLLAREGEMSPADISEHLGIPRPSVYRLLDGLGAIGLTEPMQHSRTRLSLRWLHLADGARAAVSEWRGVADVLTEVVEETAFTAYFSVLRGDEAVCLEWEQGRSIGVLALRPGRSLPLHAGAEGRMVLAHEVDLESYLEESERKRYTARTLVSPEELRADVALTREQGYVISDEDFTDGLGAIGVPVQGRDGGTAVLSIAGLASHVVPRAAELAEIGARYAGRIESLAAGSA